MTLTPLQALARATSALVSHHDLADVLSTLVSDACSALDATAGGVLVLTPDGALEVVAATSHRVLDLELYQAQEREGPCAEAVLGRETVVEQGIEGMRQRWPHLSTFIDDAGYDGVQAHPMRWQGDVLGAVNIYHHARRSITDDDLLLGQTFADIATLILLTPQDLSAREISAGISTALSSRSVIEYAKGVLMHSHQVGPEQAYELLLERSRSEGVTLTHTATAIVSGAHRPD
jgi:GAF domain-containing protein